MTNPVNSYILNIYDLNTHFVDIFNKPELSFFFLCTPLSSFRYCYLIWIILYTVDYFFAHSWIILSFVPMARETMVQSQVESYQRLKKWYLISPYLTLSIIRYISRVKWSNPRKGVVPFPTPWCCSYWKGRLQVALDYCHQLDLLILFNITHSFGHR